MDRCPAGMASHLRTRFETQRWIDWSEAARYLKRLTPNAIYEEYEFLDDDIKKYLDPQGSSSKEPPSRETASQADREPVSEGASAMARAWAVISQLLAEHGRVTQAEVREKLEVSSTQAKRILDRLEARGLIEQREKGPASYYVAVVQAASDTES